MTTRASSAAIEELLSLAAPSSGPWMAASTPRSGAGRSRRAAWSSGFSAPRIATPALRRARPARPRTRRAASSGLRHGYRRPSRRPAGSARGSGGDRDGRATISGTHPCRGAPGLAAVEHAPGARGSRRDARACPILGSGSRSRDRESRHGREDRRPYPERIGESERGGGRRRRDPPGRHGPCMG